MNMILLIHTEFFTNNFKHTYQSTAIVACQIKCELGIVT